jgi:hypothetical protein
MTDPTADSHPSATPLGFGATGDQHTNDSELRLVVALRRAARERGGPHRTADRWCVNPSQTVYRVSRGAVAS